MSTFDARITAARGDIAASHLRGRVAAKSFVDGTDMIVSVGRAALRAGPSAGAGMASELLYGERVIVYERRDGWAWVQSASDAYVGYVREDQLAAPAGDASHRVTAALMTPLLPAPDIKRPALDMLPLNALVEVAGREGRFARLASRGFVFANHLAPRDNNAGDWVAVAEAFIGVPYIWGGKSAAGIDCSGLIQTSLAAAGIACPRDSDMQEASLGTSIAGDSPLQPGDLIFWKGHAGIMRDATHLLHANAFHMQVASEPYAEAVTRIARSSGHVIAIKRL